MEEYLIKPYADNKKINISIDHLFDKVNNKSLRESLEAIQEKLEIIYKILFSKLSIMVVDNIAQRNALIVQDAQTVYVSDAYADTKIHDYAMYVYLVDKENNGSWHRLNSAFGYFQSDITIG